MKKIIDFFKKYGLLILLLAAGIAAAFKIPGLGFISNWKNKKEKEGVDKKYDDAKKKVEENNKKIEEMKKEFEQETEENTEKKEAIDKEVKRLEDKQKNFEKEVDNAKNNRDKLIGLADDLGL